MRYGLLADIHEDVRFLRLALDRFGADGVDRVVVLGDLFETGRQIEEVARLLADVGAIGVWGNHDYGLCHEPREDVRARFSPECLAFMTSLGPYLEFEDCLATHVEPWRDAEDLYELWSFERTEDWARSFAVRRHRLMFHGHHHRWAVHDLAGRVAWDCFHPLSLDPSDRYVIQVGALCDGRCGVLDLSANVLTPIDLRDGP